MYHNNERDDKISYAVEDIANVALFLASDEANYITGSIYAVDGGMGAA